MMLEIASIVEGDGEVFAVPALLHRIQKEFDPTITLIAHRPIQIDVDKIKQNQDVLGKYIKVAATNFKKSGGILILVDADDDCPATLGPSLLERANAFRPDVPKAVVIAKSEFEGWFLAVAESLRGIEGFPDDLEAHPNPENKRDAKGWLGEKRGRKYSPPIDQVKLTRVFDMALARKRADSFCKMYREVTRLLALLRDANREP